MFFLKRLKKNKVKKKYKYKEGETSKNAHKINIATALLHNLSRGKKKKVQNLIREN